MFSVPKSFSNSVELNDSWSIVVNENKLFFYHDGVAKMELVATNLNPAE